MAKTTKRTGKNAGKKTSDQEQATYEVGYGKPPKDTQFGGERANKQGKNTPKNFTQLRALAKQIAGEELGKDKENVITRIEAMLRLMTSSKNPADRRLFLEYAFGKPKEEIDLTLNSEAITELTDASKYERAIDTLNTSLATIGKSLLGQTSGTKRKVDAPK